MADRDHDVVLFGATGFTGALTAHYLAQGAAAGARWALAGRNVAKLERLRAELATVDPRLEDLPLLQADSSDQTSLDRVAGSTKVLVTTVGPYIRYGEPLVAACAKNGTGYLDLTGEPEFADRMWIGYHEQAQRTGARLIHACGFDSVPWDLGVLFTVGKLPEGVPITVRAVGRTNGSFSGGTYHSAIGIMARLRQGYAAARERARTEAVPANRRFRIVSKAPINVPEAGGWALPAPTIDPQIVLRSARALDRYGPDFAYGHYMHLGGPVASAAIAAGAGVAVLAAQAPPTRNLLYKLKSPGEGPDAARRARTRFTVTLIGEGGGQRVHAEVTGGDPGYGETAKMLAEAALCLAQDELPDVAGQTTTAAALGWPLIERLQKAEIGFNVVEAVAVS